VLACEGRQIIRGLLRFRGGGEDRLLVGLKDAQPVGDVARVIGTKRRRNAQIRAEKRRAKFSDLS
jgi:hypothetical protein